MAEKKMRCAVYTRKSTEDGLEQAFNSLDAQYEACAAYAMSQRHEGWMLVKERYDDGGFSGGNMQRPGLQRLLADVAVGRIDIILVYKIDRLTRSLADFAKIVEVLDKAGASFVSITQAFNTTTSMGRLTLNMLLSFAQFEREVTGERIRDKIAASKRKGLWMGGPVPLGYQVIERKLVVVDTEAELVRQIYRRYLHAVSVDQLASDLNAEGHRTKIQHRASGPHRGGCIFRRGTLYHLLSNRIYLGKIVHKGEAYEGEHEAIVPTPLWEAVQEKLRESASGTSRRIRAQKPSLLVGLIFDGEGRAMTPTHATKEKQRYRYYVTRPDQLDGSPAWRVSAHDLERLVCERLAQLLGDGQAVHDLAGDVPAEALNRAIANADAKRGILCDGTPHQKIEILSVLIDRIDLHEDRIDLTLLPTQLRGLLQLPAETAASSEPLILSLPVVKVRHGHQLRLVIPGPEVTPTRQRDEKLVSLIAEAHEARKLLFVHPGRSLSAIGSAHGRCRTRLGKLIALSCMAPDIIQAVREGRQPASLTARMLLRTELPIAWDDQRQMLGFG